MRPVLSSDFDRFVGVPYLDKGRTLAGCDCWGLFALVQRECRGLDLPTYDERYVTAADRAAMARLIAGELDAWAMIAQNQEQTFDGLLMRQGKFPRHVGLVIAPGRVLHVEPGRTSVIESYRSGILASRVVGFYRHANMKSGS